MEPAAEEELAEEELAEAEEAELSDWGRASPPPAQRFADLEGLAALMRVVLA